MRTNLSEEEMRRALFGDAALQGDSGAKRSASDTSRKPSHQITSKIRVTLQVTNEFEGGYEEVVFDSPSLSTLVAVMDAKKKYKRYRYITVVSTARV